MARSRRRRRWRSARRATARSSPSSRRCARAASAVRTLPGGKKETVIVGDKVSEGDKTLVRCSPPTGGRRCSRPDGKPLLVDLSTLEEVSTGRSLRLAIRPLIDAFSGNAQLADPDWTVRKGAATKMGNSGDPAALPALAEALAKEQDRWVRYELEQAMALIRLKAGTDAERAAAATTLGDAGQRRRPGPAARGRRGPGGAAGGAAGGGGRREAGGALGAPHLGHPDRASRASRSAPSCS